MTMTVRKPYIVERDGEPTLRFTGELLASTSSSSNQADGTNYSGETGRWSELALYRTNGGKLICEQVGRTQWTGEHDRCSARVCDTEAQVFEFFGHGWLAKDLYDAAGIDATETID